MHRFHLPRHNNITIMNNEQVWWITSCILFTYLVITTSQSCYPEPATADGGSPGWCDQVYLNKAPQRELESPSVCTPRSKAASQLSSNLMASIPTLLFLALSFSMGCCLTLFDPLLTFANQNPNIFIVVLVHTFLFVLLPFTFFSAIVLLLSYVVIPQSAQPPLLRASTYLFSQTEHILMKLKSLASHQNRLVLALAVSISVLLLLEPLSTISNKTPNNSLIFIAVHAFLFFLLSCTFFSAIILLLVHVAMLPTRHSDDCRGMDACREEFSTRW